jgi:hypothetical protein
MSGSHPLRWLVLLVCGALTALGCSTDTPQGESGGSLSLDLTIADGVEINIVAWEISGGDMEPMSGVINTSDPNSTASVEVFGIPPGEDYLIEMMAIATDEETRCNGSAMFDIEVGETTPVHVMLNCKRPERFGGVRVDGWFNICAELVKVVVSPLQTSVGSDIDLDAQAEDAEDDPITYEWTATGGEIDDANAPSTTYTCGEVGEQLIRIMVTDDDEFCDMAEWTVAVECVLGEVECLENSDCTDLNQCTINICADGRCVDSDSPAGDGCIQDDGSMCDGEGNCVECNNELDCDVDETCVDGWCILAPDCTDDIDCTDGNQCTINLCAEGTCVDTDSPPGDGCEDGGVCDGQGNCVECNVNDDCGLNEVCEANVCVEEAECEVDAQCEDDIQCTLNNCVLGACVTTDADPGDTCDQDGGTMCDGAGACVECTEKTDCGAEETCVANACVSDPDLFCDTGACVGDTDLRAECVDKFLLCLADNVNEEECVALSLLICIECNTGLDCGDDNECTDNVCTDGVCSNPNNDDNMCDAGSGPGSGTCNAGVCQDIGPDCGDHVCTFTSATESAINLFTPLFAFPLVLDADGSADVLCGGNSPDANGKCGCETVFGVVDPLTIPGLGIACLIPVPPGTCPLGDIDCDGGNDQDVDLQVDHNLNTTLSNAACTGNFDPPAPGCQTDCATHCIGQGAVPAQALCEGFCQLAGTACNTDDPTDPNAPDPPGPITCPAGDTCVGGDPVIHPGACQCTCLTIGNNQPDAAGNARMFGGFGLNVLLASQGSTPLGPDGIPCTEDDIPSIEIPPQCAPFTTTSATTMVTNAGDVAGDTIPTGGPVTVTGTPFTCDAVDLVPTSPLTGTNLRTAAAFPDTTLGDLAATVVLNCQ